MHYFVPNFYRGAFLHEKLDKVIRDINDILELYEITKFVDLFSLYNAAMKKW